MFKNTAQTPGELNGFLDAGSHIQGELSFEDTFRVDGKVTGTVQSKGELVVGERGEVDGEIRVGRLFVTGVVKGQVEAIQGVEIHAKGKVFARLDTPSLIIEDGALFEGQCSMKSRQAGAATAAPPATPAAAAGGGKP